MKSMAENHNKSKRRVLEHSPIDMSTKHSITYALGNIAKRRQKDCKIQMTKEFAVRLCLVVIWEATYISLTARLPKHELSNDSRRGSVDGGRDLKISTLHKELQATKNAERRKVIFSREEYTYWLSSTEWWALKYVYLNNTHTYVYICVFFVSVLCVGLCMCVCM